jgi:four helix bundle protein
MKKNIIVEKSFAFSLRILKLSEHLISKKEFIISKQLLRCGTSVGANIREAQYAESKRDFIHKLSISLKEANETKYWLDLIYATELIAEKMYLSFNKDCEEILKLLTAIINSSKQRIN